MTKIVGIIPHKTNNLELNNLATKIFTVGGVDITTNLQPKSTFVNIIPTLSTTYDLDSLPPSNVLFLNKTKSGNVKLNYNKNNPKYYAKYGSLLELLRVSIETIILKFPASINSKTSVLNRVGTNIINCGYYPLDDTTIFSANVSYFSNPFDIYFLNNLNFKYSDDRINPIRNLTQNYLKYELVVDGVSYPILAFTSSTLSSNDFVTIQVSGKPFDIGNNSKEFYIKPIESEFIDFYKNLEDFESHLLNPLTDYSAKFETKKAVNGGLILDYTIKFQFPKLDLYNLDIKTSKYETYLNDITEFATEFDENEGNWLMRHLVPENIQSVTLEDVNTDDNVAGKMNKLLIVYGRELDEINRYIQNIRFFNTVTYNRKDNRPDDLLVSFANHLGWDTFNENIFDYEKWRLLILNSWWIWKSKGTRKAIEFLLKFSGIPNEIVDFNEYILRAKKPIDVKQLEFYYSLFSDNFDLSTLPIDAEGYPKYSPNTPNDYFQMNGNNDRGMAYFYKYYNLLPSTFTGTTVNYTGSTTSLKTIFEQDFNSGNTLGYIISDTNSMPNDCYDNSGTTILDPYPTAILDECGCPLPISDKSLEICVNPKDLSSGCTKIILDIFYDCISASGATLYINSYGGTPPITLSGATNGQFVISGETINVIATDSKGCVSDEYSVYINCVDPCLGTFIEVDLDYDCILNEFGQNTGEAVISLSYSGGEPPYQIIGVQSGDTVNHGEIVTVQIIDANGCTSDLVGLTIDCPPPNVVECIDITLNATLETTNVELANQKAKVNVTYDLIGIPTGTFVDSVTMTTVGFGVDNSYVVGSPVVTTFSTINGVDTIQLDYTPNAIEESITLTISIDVLLTNGCEYNATYNLTVNPLKLGNADFYDTVLNPI